MPGPAKALRQLKANKSRGARNEDSHAISSLVLACHCVGKSRQCAGTVLSDRCRHVHRPVPIHRLPDRWGRPSTCFRRRISRATPWTRASSWSSFSVSKDGQASPFLRAWKTCRTYVGIVSGGVVSGSIGRSHSLANGDFSVSV